MTSRIWVAGVCLVMVLGCSGPDPDAGSNAFMDAALSPSPVTGAALQGEWYNTVTSTYPDPSIAIVKFHPAGGVVMTGLDGSAQYGEYRVSDDGRLTIRLAVRNRATLTTSHDPGDIESARAQLMDYPTRVIFDAKPALRQGRLELQTPDILLVFSREAVHQAAVSAATEAFQLAHEAAIKAEEEQRKQLAEQRRRENLRRVRSVLGIKSAALQLSGAGAKRCGAALQKDLRRLGWRFVRDPNQADAVLSVYLSGIQYMHSAWIGRYYKMTYAVKISRSSDGHVLAAFDGAERAAGDGPYETCTDTTDEIVDEIEDLIDDQRS